MEESLEMSPQACQWAHNVIVAFRRERNRRGGYITAKWEKRMMISLKEWAGRNSERSGVSFAWWMVDKTHSILMFKEMNGDGVASEVATRLAEFY